MPLLMSGATITQSAILILSRSRCDLFISFLIFYWQGGHVRGSYQWPAQTFFDDLDGFYEKFKDVEKVIFYCASSNGRGPRCAGW